jgi:integration host factor subunit alpha
MTTITRTDLAERVALASEALGKTTLTNSEAKSLVNEVLAILSAELVATGEVKISGFGSFKVRRRPGHPGRNPRRPEEVHEIPPHQFLTFKASDELKRSVRHEKGRPEERPRNDIRSPPL